MGGHAFLSHTPPLPTPRMPLEIYNLVLNQTLDALRKHYAHVASSIEGPEKEDYGDVDILVTGALEPVFDPAAHKEVAESLAKVLGAKAYITENGNPTANFAVPWPTGTPAIGDEDAALNGKAKDEKFVQIDVHYCPDEDRFKWELFHSAHGDLWNMLGTTIRPLGLTVNDKGLYLRIEDIEKYDKKKSYVFLTSNPKAVLEFLGLEESKWWTQFPSRQEMFEYAAGSRCFWVQSMKEGGDGDNYGDVTREVDLLIQGGQEGGEMGKKKLRHNDRQRMSKRPIFAQWIEDFIPSCRKSGKYTTAKVSREQIKKEAFETFGVNQAYETQLHKWKLTRHKDELWRVTIKESVPVEGVDFGIRAAAIRMLKVVVMEGESVEGVKVPEEVRCNEQGFWDLDAVKRFVEENWHTLGQIGWKRQQVKAIEGMKAKQDAKRKRDEERLGKVAVKKA